MVQAGDLVWRLTRSRLRLKKRAIETIRKQAGANNVILDIDEMESVSTKSYHGQQVIDVNARPAQRAKQEIDYGRSAFGYVYGALWETTGECWNAVIPEPLHSTLCDFLCYVDSQIPEDKDRIPAIIDNLEMHHCRDLLLLMIHYPRWGVVYQPTMRPI